MIPFLIGSAIGLTALQAGIDTSGGGAPDHELVVQLAAEGKALLYYSSETEEIAQLCNRVLVMREGRIVAELDRDADAEAIVAASVRVARA